MFESARQTRIKRADEVFWCNVTKKDSQFTSSCSRNLFFLLSSLRIINFQTKQTHDKNYMKFFDGFISAIFSAD